MTSHVMLSNGAAYVLDCGLGVTDQFARTGIPFGALRSIFITHHHPDHNIEYGPLLVIGWLQGMRLNVRAFGPPPLKQNRSKARLGVLQVSSGLGSLNFAACG